MGRFAAEFRGFWPGWGRGAAIQRTADTGGRSGQKIFKNSSKEGWKTEKLGCDGGERGAGRWSERTLYRVCGSGF